MTNPILEVVDLEKSYGGKKVVRGTSFHIHRGEVVGLIGPNGAGKTTSFYMTMGLIRPDNGRVLFNGNVITNAPVDQRARMGLGYLAQEPSIFRSLTVEQNIICVLEMLKLTKKELKARLSELLEELHLTQLAKERAISLSGGERRRLEITRALATNPSCLLLDEPFANIDPLAIADVQRLIRYLSKKGISVLITDHNAREILATVSRSYLMRDGKVFLEGSVEELLNSQEAKTYYLGDDFRM